MRNKDDSLPPPEVDSALIAGLAARAGELSTLVEDLIATVRINRLARVYVIIVTVALIAGMGVSVWNTISTRRATDKIDKNNKLIVSCVDPDGSCYKEARQASRENIKLINDTTAAAALCAQRPENQTFDQLKACILTTLNH